MEVSGQFHVPDALPPQGKTPWYALDGKLVGLRAVLDANQFERPIIQPVAQRYTIELTWLHTDCTYFYKKKLKRRLYVVSLGVSGRGVKLTTHLHLVPRSRMCGAIPPLPHYVCMAWRLVKHMDNFTFYLCKVQLLLYFMNSQRNETYTV
jgi:hypothetical protein